MKFALSNCSRQFAIGSLVLMLFCSWGWRATGQTKDQLAAKYKKIEAFEIRPGILAFSTFATDGRICRMLITKTAYIDANTSDFENTIPSLLVGQLVDEVVSPSERGRSAKYLNSDSFVAGGTALIKQDYENVSVSVSESGVVGGDYDATAIVIDWTKRNCPPSR